MILSYELCPESRIRRIEGDWDGFATRNQARELHREKVLGQPLWSYVHGAETRMLLEALLARVRTDGAPVAVPFRCDSPDRRRYMEMRVHRLLHGWLHVESEVVREEARAPVMLLADRPPGEGPFLPVCSWCKSVRMANGRWVEVEEAIERMRLFDDALLPPITHGICHSCLAVLESSLVPG